ncbi:hypothetical protein HY485_03365 [Candidatus Woesearchaeota archaeon]|nr:hypothetical protein [Candidatus Woesearchaeota archaeon]
MTTKDLINFDKHGRPRTPEEIADICADASIAVDEHGVVRTSEEIAAIKWKRVQEKPDVEAFLKEGLEKMFKIYETTLVHQTCTRSNVMNIAERLRYLRSQQAHQPAEHELVLEPAYR